MTPGTDVCPLCGLSPLPEVRRAVAAVAGHWHVRNTPRRMSRGVSGAVVLKQVHAGLVRSVTVVKGPGTAGEWQLAGRVPGLAKHLGLCHHCDTRVSPQVALCPNCGGELPDFAINNDEIAGDPTAQAEAIAAGWVGDPTGWPTARRWPDPLPHVAPLDGLTPCYYCGHELKANGPDSGRELSAVGSSARCDLCGRSQATTERLRALETAGWWYILDEPDHLSRGVSLAHLIAKVGIGPGKLEPRSVVRSPTTGGEWRFAARTPGLAVLMGCCHKCGEPLPSSEASCCGACQAAVVELVVLRDGQTHCPPANGSAWSRYTAPTRLREPADDDATQPAQ